MLWTGTGHATALPTTPTPPPPATAPTTATVPADPAGLSREITQGVEDRLPEGDRFRITVSGDQRTVWGRRYDRSSGAWGDRSVLLRKHNLYCGDVDARSASGSVAVIAKCDEYGYSEDQAPVSSHALFSDDLTTWHAQKLSGEATDEPGISHDGSRAVWPQSGGYLSYDAERHFVAHELETPGMEYTLTAVVTDPGAVSLLYGESSNDGQCSLTVVTRSPDGSTDTQRIPEPAACADLRLTNVDAHTVLLGDANSPAHTVTIGRSGDTAPWAVTGIAPELAPGLDRHEGRRAFDGLFLHAAGLPLIAVGSPNGRTLRVPTYDDVAQRWAPARTALTLPRACAVGEDHPLRGPVAVALKDLRCPDGTRILATTDGKRWHAPRIGRRPLGLTARGRVVAIPGRTRTLLLSRAAGAIRLPAGAPGRCDVVVPAGPRAAVRLTTRPGHKGWPRVLQHSTATGWRTIKGVTVPRARVGACSVALAEHYDLPYQYTLASEDDAMTIRILKRSGAWRVILDSVG